MFPGSLPQALPLFFSATLAAGLAYYAFRRRETPGGATFGSLLLTLAVWCLFTAVEFLAPTLPEKIWAAKLGYVAVAGAPPLWLAFALRYTHRTHWLTRRNKILLMLPSLLIAILILTNEWHFLVWVDVDLDQAGGTPVLVVLKRGAANLIFIAVAYVMILLGNLLHLSLFVRAPRFYRWQISVMVLSSILPLGIHFMYLVGLGPAPGLNPTPLAFVASAVLLILGFFRFSLLDISPIAAYLVVDHLPDAVIILDSHDRLIDFNPAARKLFGVDTGGIGQKVDEALPLPAALRTLITAPGIRTEVEIGNGDHRWFQLTVSLLMDPRGERLGRSVLLHDITRERTLRQTRDDLTQMIIHDLRNPLSAIYTALDMLGVGEWNDDPETQAGRSFEEREALKVAYQSALRAQEMIDSALSVARLEGKQLPVNIGQVDIGEVAGAVARQMKPLADEQNLILELQLDANLPAALADYQLLDRIIRNLVGNAIKFVPTGGRVSIAARPAEAKVLVSVADTGPGIPAAVQDRLFEKFARGEGGRGYGLGLAFCKLAVEAMQGRIWFESAPGQGTTFYFTLPQA